MKWREEAQNRIIPEWNGRTDIIPFACYAFLAKMV